MKRFIGTFSVDLPCRIFVSGPKETGLVEQLFEVRVDDRDVTVRLLPDEALQRETDDLLIWSVSKATVVVDGDCAEPVPLYPSGTAEDFDQQAMEYNNFFMKMLEQYSLTGVTVLNRLLRFFRFCLKNHHATMMYTSGLLDVVWSDETGKTYPFELRYVRPTPDTFYLWYDESILVPERLADLQGCMAQDVYPDLHMELLVDAWAALGHRNERRAVIEGAIACEAAVKAAFFGFDTVAANALEFLEEKARAKLPVIQYLHSAAKRVFGRSFKEEMPDEYKCIESLFSVRNKAAHRGLCYFRDDHGRVVLVDDQVVGQWLRAVEKAFDWLKDVHESLERERRQYETLPGES